MLCCVALCCVWCGVWRGLARRKKPSCVDSKRPRVYRHHAHMCYHMRAWCRYTRGRFESTHGGRTHGGEGMKGGRGRGVTVSSANHEMAHVELSLASQRFTGRNHWFFPIQGLRTGREQHVFESSNHSLYLMKLLRDTAEGISTHNTHLRTNTYSPTHPPPLTSPPSLPNAHVHARVYVHARVCICICRGVCTCICVCVSVSVSESVSVSVSVSVCVRVRV